MTLFFSFVFIFMLNYMFMTFDNIMLITQTANMKRDRCEYNVGQNKKQLQLLIDAANINTLTK